MRSTPSTWDIGLIGAEPARAEKIAFTPAYVEIEATYMVPSGSKLNSLAQVDQAGVRIAVSARSAYDLWLERNIKHAELCRADGLDGSYDLFVRDKLEALAGLRPRLLSDVEKTSGSKDFGGTVYGGSAGRRHRSHQCRRCGISARLCGRGKTNRPRRKADRASPCCRTLRCPQRHNEFTGRGRPVAHVPTASSK